MVRLLHHHFGGAACGHYDVGARGELDVAVAAVYLHTAEVVHHGVDAAAVQHPTIDEKLVGGDVADAGLVFEDVEEVAPALGGFVVGHATFGNVNHGGPLIERGEGVVTQYGRHRCAAAEGLNLGAVGEGFVADGGHGRAEGHAFKAYASAEAVVADAAGAVADVHARHLDAAVECLVADFFHRVRDGHADQTTHCAERFLADLSGAVGHFDGGFCGHRTFVFIQALVDVNDTIGIGVDERCAGEHLGAKVGNRVG